MLRFKTVVTPGTTSEVTLIVCPHCGSRDSFHLWAPAVCNKCGKPLEDAIRIRKNEKRKLMYHRGKVD